MKYFTYGSNMDQEDLNKWCGLHSYPNIDLSGAQKAKLNNYKLQFNYYSSYRMAGVANIMNSNNDEVWGLIVSISEGERDTIRKKEGCPNSYKEINVDIEDENGNIEYGALTYKVVENRKQDKHVPPTREYLDLIINNAKKYKFPSKYIEYLESIKIA